MTDAFLGIDTSNYTTSCALADENGGIIISHKALLPVKQGDLGLRQSDAIFAHLKQFPDVYQNVCGKMQEHRIKAVCVSSKPRDGMDSYMPVFLAGKTLGQTIAQTLGIPCYETTHQKGHIAAALIQSEGIRFPFTTIHLSGGTTDFLSVDEHGIHTFASANDIHAGQLIDRLGVLMGFPFPSGKHMEELTGKVKSTGRYSAIVKADGIWLSGVESQAKRDMEQGIPFEQIAADVYDVLSRLIIKTLDIFAPPSKMVLVTGGVASSAHLKGILNERSEKRGGKYSFTFSQPQYASDNAAGVAIIGRNLYYAKGDENTAWLSY